MSFKSLNDKYRREALPYFLRAAGTVHGLLASFAISKSIRGLTTTRTTLQAVESLRPLRAKWNSYEFEKMARVTHFVSLLVAGLLTPHQEIIWISDMDDIMANADRKADAGRILCGFMDLYAHSTFGLIKLGTTDIDPGDRGEEDLAAIPDLVAGSLAEALTKLSSARDWYHNSNSAVEGTTKKSHQILSWLFRAPKRLAHVEAVFDKNSDGEVVLFPLCLD